MKLSYSKTEVVRVKLALRTFKPLFFRLHFDYLFLNFWLLTIANDSRIFFFLLLLKKWKDLIINSLNVSDLDQLEINSILKEQFLVSSFKSYPRAKFFEINQNDKVLYLFIYLYLELIRILSI